MKQVYMKRGLTLILALLALTANIFAGPIRDDYFKTKDEIEKVRDTPETRKAFLELNVQRSLRRLLSRYYDYANPEKVKITSANYEQSEKDKLTYYIKFEDYVGFITFSNDPEYFYALPREEKIIRKVKAEKSEASK